MLEAGADKDTADNEGITALMAACWIGHIELARLLLEAGASKDIADNNGVTALMTAGQADHVQVVRLLLECPTGFCQ